MSDYEDLRAYAEQAQKDNPGPWIPYFTVHGDPHVNRTTPDEMGWTLGIGTVCSVSTGPVDYGRSTAEHIAAADPVKILELLDRLEALELLAEAAADSLAYLKGKGYPTSNLVWEQLVKLGYFTG